MKSLKEELSEVLRNAEDSILNIMSRAATERDYEVIDKARLLAEQLRNIESVGQPRQTIINAASAKGKRRTSGNRTSKSKASGSYPKFKVENGSLYKIGWSKKKSAEYTHRLTIESALEVIAVLDQISIGNSGIVPTDQIIESVNISSYKTYLVLALLKQEKIITAAGRDGYRLPGDIFPQADSLFHSIEDK